jgi:hypothetical protein
MKSYLPMVIKTKAVPRRKDPWRLFGSALCLVGGGALLLKKRPIHAAVVLSAGTLLSFSAAHARKTVPGIFLGTIVFFAASGFVFELERKQLGTSVFFPVVRLSYEYTRAWLRTYKLCCDGDKGPRSSLQDTNIQKSLGRLRLKENSKSLVREYLFDQA